MQNAVNLFVLVYIHNYIIACVCFCVFFKFFVHYKNYQCIPLLIIKVVFNQFSLWRTTTACQSRWTKILFLSYNANLRHLHRDNLTHRKKVYNKSFLKKNLDNITQDDITKVCQEVRKPVAEQECFYNNFYGIMKLVNIYSQELFIPSLVDLIYDVVQQGIVHIS